MEAEPLDGLVALAQLSGRGEGGNGSGSRGHASGGVELDELVSVGGVDEGNVQTFAGGVELGLLQAVGGRVLLGLGLDQGHSYGLIACVDGQSEGVVDSTRGLASRMTVYDVYHASGLLTADEVFGPLPRMQGWVDELGPGIRFSERHTGL